MLDKELQWAPEIIARRIFNTPNRDIALNQLIELNAKDVNLRADVVECDLGPNGVPMLSVEVTSKEQTAATIGQPSAA